MNWKKKTGMTEEAADYSDEYYTKNPPKVDPAKNRIKMEPLTIVVEGITAQYLKSASEATHKTPAEIIGGLVHEKIAVAG